jgi:hypothetical protein
MKPRTEHGLGDHGFLGAAVSLGVVLIAVRMARIDFRGQEDAGDDRDR